MGKGCRKREKVALPVDKRGLAVDNVLLYHAPLPTRLTAYTGKDCVGKMFGYGKVCAARSDFGATLRLLCRLPAELGKREEAAALCPDFCLFTGLKGKCYDCEN